MTGRTLGPATVALALLALAGGSALLLAAPGRTVASAYLNDLMIFLDGAHRIASGQVPGRDFHTALGPLAYYLPAAGLHLSGSMGDAMPWGLALAILLVAPALAHVLSSRLGPVLALAYGTFLVVVLAMPANLGDSATALSFAMFYNRLGWVALGLLLVMYLPPARSPAWDALAAAFLLLVMLFTKVTFGLVALAFLVLLLFDRRHRAWAAAALAAAAGAALVVELLWRSTAAHLADLALAAEVSGFLREGPATLLQAALRNSADYVLFALICGLASWRTRRAGDLAFYGFCAVSGLLIVIQNAQSWGILSLHAGAMVAAQTLLDRDPAGPPRRFAMQPGVLLFALALLLPTIVHGAIALAAHTVLAAGRRGESLPLPRFSDVAHVDTWWGGDPRFAERYLASLRDGAGLLLAAQPRPERVSVLDFANPFSAGLGLLPPGDDASWLHWRRNVDTAHFIPPDRLLGDAQYVMEPKWGINPDGLRLVYGPYVSEHFDRIAETELWILHRRRAR